MDELRSLFDKARFRSEERGFIYALVGRHNVDTTISYAVTGRADFLYCTIPGKTVIIARNDVGVPQIEDFPVKLRKDSLGTYVIIGRATNSTVGAPTATPPSGVVAHATTHQHGGTDEVATATPGANAIIKADADGKIGAGWLDSADLAAQIHAATNKATIVDADELAIADSAATYGLKHVLFSVIKDTIKAYYDSVVTTLTNKTLDSTNISTLTSKTTPIDADSVVLVDSAASNVFKRVTGTNLKAYLKTYFDTLYNLYVHPNHSGDVTSVGDGATTIGASKVLTTMIANDNVTFAKVQNIATDSLIGRDTASSGDPENILLNATLSMDGAGNLQRAALTGDVTASAGSNATTIANDAVTYAKMQNIATDSLIGRDTASTGDPETIGLNATLAMDGAGNLQRAALTGDVTATAGSNATTIANDAVSNAKAANMAADTIKGRANGAGTGDPTDLTATQVRTIINVENGADVTDAGNIASSITGVSTDDTIVDADVWGYLTGGALVKTAWSNIKAVLKTYFDTLYGALATANTWAGIQTHEAAMRITGTGVAHGMTTIAPTNVAGAIQVDDNAEGGVTFLGLTDVGNTRPAFSFIGVVGDADPTDTIPAFRIRGDKKNGTGSQALGAAETVLEVTTFATSLLQLLGGGELILPAANAKMTIGLSSSNASLLGIQAGTSSNDAAVGGVLYETHTTVGQVGAGPDVLATYTVPASTLGVNGQSLWWECSGEIDVAGPSATITIEFGATTVCTVSGSVSGGWYARGRIYRSGAATQVASSNYATNGGTPGIAHANPAETLSGTVVLRVRGDSTADANNDTTLWHFIVGYDDANT